MLLRGRAAVESEARAAALENSTSGVGNGGESDWARVFVRVGSLSGADAELEEEHEAEHRAAGNGRGLPGRQAHVGPARAALVVGDRREEHALGQRVHVLVHLVGGHHHLGDVEPAREIELRLGAVAEHPPLLAGEVPHADFPEPAPLLLSLDLVLYVHGDGDGLLDGAASWKA